tara:strand:+ start:48602 stop:48718 length:117 start_codon:yes stop_codon:yes gene_type:complete
LPWESFLNTENHHHHKHYLCRQWYLVQHGLIHKGPRKD